MGFWENLVGLLITKKAIRSYQRDLRNEYSQKKAILDERERRIRAEERRQAEEEREEEEWMLEEEEWMLEEEEWMLEEEEWEEEERRLEEEELEEEELEEMIMLGEYDGMTEAERQEYFDNMNRIIEEKDELHRQRVIEYEGKLADYEAKIAQLKQEEGDHSEDIEILEFYANNARNMIRIYKKSLGEGEYPG